MWNKILFNIKKQNIIGTKSKKAFTLFEIVLALIIFSMLVGVIFTAYINIKKSEVTIWAQQIVTKEANDFLDRLHDLSLDYTIDYEEYFNRTIIKCGSEKSPDFARNQDGECPQFTKYGNTGDNDGMYYCNSSWDLTQSWYYISKFILIGPDPIWCVQTWKQNFWQYNRQFRDTKDSHLNNGDDIFTGRWPVAIAQNTWVQELYLINNDWDHRVYFRRKLLTWVDLNWDWGSTWKNEGLYTIQTLKLKWFDAGEGHNFDTWPSNWWVYDWFIDTRACDADAWFVCNWSGLWIGEYSWYNLPLDVDDGRVDITNPKITVSDWNFELYPAKDPYLAKKETWYLLDPFVKVNLTTNIYGKQVEDEITLQTSLSFKNSYHNFEMEDLTWFLP